MAGTIPEPGSRAHAVNEAIQRIQSVTGMLDGGNLVSVREALVKVFDQGALHGARLESEASRGPRTTSEALGRPKVAGHASERAGDTTEGRADWSELAGWWEQTAVDEIRGLLAKMEEYGGMHRATDLTDIGRAMVEAGVSQGPLLASGAVQDGWLQELGAYFYLRGKFARWVAAIIEGRPVSDDTLHDIAIYTRMVQRIRAVGGWPV